MMPGMRRSGTWSILGRPVAVALLCLPSGMSPVSAAPEGPASVYSEIAPGRCGPKLKPNPAEHETVRHGCRVLGRFAVEAVYRGTSVTFTVKGPDGPALQLGAPYAVGDRIEWRGARAGGRFVPGAAILRLSGRDVAGRVVSGLAVLRVDGGRVCLAGVLDAGRADANGRAREAGDRAASGPGCAGIRAAAIGPETAIVQDILERSR